MSRPTGDSPPRMRGATASVAGSRGIVPKPTAGQHNFMLLGDGTWGAQPVAGLPSQTSNSGKLLTTDGTNASWTTTGVLTSLTSPASTPLTLGTGTSGAAITVLSASNYVGIGTATPQGKLEVSASSVTVNVVSPDNASLNIIRGATTNYNNLRFGTGNSTTFTEDWSLQTRADADSGNQFSITRGSNTDTFVIKKSNGYVGIGTATPSSKLEVSGSASGNTVIVNGGQLILRDFDSTVGGQVQLYNKLANSGFSIKNTGATGTSVLQFSKDSTDVLAISNTGDVSIASTTAGSSGAGALVVAGGISGGNTGAASYFGGALSIAAGGNFIVGSSASTGQSNIQFGNSGGGSQIGVESVGGGSLAAGSTAYATVVGSYTNTALQLFTNGTVRLTISNTGAATFAGAVSVSGTAATWTSGTGSPESVKTAPVGSLYTRTDGGASTTLYVKESGAGNTGWIAK